MEGSVPPHAESVGHQAIGEALAENKSLKNLRQWYAEHGADYLAMVIGMPTRETSVTVTWNSS